MDEYLNICDNNGKIISSKLRSKVHVDGDLHKAVFIWVLNDKNEILLQKRNKKDSNYNKYIISVCGHVLANETSIDAAIREVYEELGINISNDDLNYINSFKNHTERQNYLNNEIDDLYYIKINNNIWDLNFNEEETSELLFISFDKLVREKNNQNKYQIPDWQFNELIKIIKDKL